MDKETIGSIVSLIGIGLFVGLFFLYDWYTYKLRGQVQPDHPEDKDSPIITNAQDASAQRLVDLGSKKSSDDTKRKK